MTRLCFVAYNAVPAVFPAEGQCVGGTETRAWTIAQGLKQHTSLQIALCVRHTRKLPAERRNGVELHCQIDRMRNVRRYVSDCLEFQSGRPRLRTFRAGLLWRIPWLAVTWPFRSRDLGPGEADPRLEKIECDAFVTFGVNVESSQVVATARTRGIPVIVCLQSNSDFEPFGSHAQPDELSAEIFQHATCVVAQTQFQTEQVERLYDRQAILMHNPIDLERWQPPAESRRDYVLWIGRADNFHKRPLRCLEIARSLPDIPFLMVMNPQDAAIAQEVQRTRPPNVTLREYVPADEMPHIFGQAKAFLSTGDPAFEGFPNVFLQAAATETPIVTMFDFDDFVCRAQAGEVVGDSVSAAADALARVCESSRSELQNQATRSCLRKDHDLVDFCKRFENLVQNALNSSTSSETETHETGELHS